MRRGQITARNLSQEMAESVITLETIHRTASERMEITLHFTTEHYLLLMLHLLNSKVLNYIHRANLHYLEKKSGKHQVHFKSRLCKNQTSYSLTCVKDPYLAENRWKNIFMTELPDQALDRAPDGDHQVGDGQVHQVVVHCRPVK